MKTRHAASRRSGRATVRQLRRGLLAGLMVCAAHGSLLAQAESPLQQDVREAVLRVPVAVLDAFGREVSGELPVTLFRPEGAGPHPLVIISHGRNTETRASYPRQRFESAARFFLRKGFVVAVPLRLGYGELASRGDPEDSIACNSPRYAPAVTAAAQQIIKVAKYLAAEAFVDPNRLVLVGQSVGGISTLAAAALRPPGLVAAINFAGGHGGSPVNHRGEPCQSAQLDRLYARMGALNAGSGSADGDGADASAGATAPPPLRQATPARGATPTLWVYTENDHYFSPRHSGNWAQVYRQAGGVADYRLLPAIGDDGHKLFSAANDVWQPMVDAFLAPLGFAQPGQLQPPAASRFAALDDESALPVRSEAALDGYRRFLASKPPRAYVLNKSGQWGYASGDDAMSRALSFCQRRSGKPCDFYAVNEDVVWKDNQ
ncbi:alpha/beta hydrolase family protein [Paucibacter sp. KCTC 42545]|uniref:alpha/beta hydrolase family protein n=1 Tax=Paucibacter sp. KCTC 42545 TaxID=1768242 RepID=UPI000733AFC0|nr:prolyl oligopeptidase family serine peptidase [Paucibacter sp. KCTC 42545]ALT78412.1 hypothetical protein AT984_15695 [Paucibacter sp. KCTC 42545]